MGFRKGSSEFHHSVVHAPYVERQKLYSVECTLCHMSELVGDDVDLRHYVCTRCQSKHFAAFFAAVAEIASQRVDEKKAKHAAKKQANLRVLGRAQFKKNGAILIGIEDHNGASPVVMHVTINSKGKVSSCLNPETGEPCEGRHWSGHCCHGDRAMQYEAERVASEQVAELLPEMAAAGDVKQHVKDSIESHEFDWVDAERAAWANATPDQRRAMYSNTFDLTYGDVA